MEERQNTYSVKNIRVKEDYVMVFFDDDKIMIPVETFYELKLRERKEIDDDSLQRLKSEEKNIKAYRSCLRKLAARDHTEKQIRTHLKRYDLSKAEANGIIDKLKTYGLLDDEKYVEGRIANYDDGNLSIRQIREKLKKDGIDESMIDRHLKKDDARESEKALCVAEKFVRSSSKRSLNAKKQYVLNKLVSAGYDYGMSHDILNKIDIESDDEMSLLKNEYERLLRKYSRKYSGYELKSRIFAALMNKGFNSDDIKKTVEV